MSSVGGDTVTEGGSSLEDIDDSDIGEVDEDFDYVVPGPGRWVRITALVLALLGLADSTYLTITHFELSILSASCPVKSGFNCVKVTTSPQSEVFGIPVAILGLAFYVAMTAVNLPPLWKTTDVRVAWLRLAMSVTGVGFVLYLLYAELFLIKALCEFCTGVHIVTFLLFVLIVSTFPSMLQRARGDGDDGPDWDEEPATA
jgi:uncharacterized membrane protein